MWNPNEENNYAWLSCQAKEHGGVESLISDIHEEGFVDGVEEGRIEGAIVGMIVGVIVTCVTVGIPYIIQKVKKKKKIKERANQAKIELREIYEKTEEFDSPKLTQVYE